MEQPKKLSEVVIVFLIPIIGYYSGYCIEYGYCMVFNIPYSLIILDVTTLSNIFLVLISLAVIIIGLDYFLSIFIRLSINQNDNESYKINQYENFSWVLILIVLLFIYYKVSFRPKFTIYIIIGTLILRILLVIFEYKNRKQKTTSSKKEEEKKVSGIIESILGTKNLNYLVLAVILTYISLSIGQYIAKDQTTFYCVNGNMDIVGIRIYGNKIAGSRIDPITRKLDPGIEIIEIVNGMKLKKLSKTELNIKD